MVAFFILNLQEYLFKFSFWHAKEVMSKVRIWELHGEKAEEGGAENLLVNLKNEVGNMAEQAGRIQLNHFSTIMNSLVPISEKDQLFEIENNLIFYTALKVLFHF